MALPRGGYSSTVSRSNWNLECWFLWREENRRTRRKTLGAGKRTNNKLNPHVTPGPGIEPGPQRWEASALTTAPSLLPTYMASSGFVSRVYLADTNTEGVPGKLCNVFIYPFRIDQSINFKFQVKAMGPHNWLSQFLVQRNRNTDASFGHPVL